MKIFEKSRGVSGRASTRHLARGNCDHGAQYFTASHQRFRDTVSDWLERGIVATWNPKIAVLGDKGLKPGSLIESPTVRMVGTPSMTAMARVMARDLDIELSTKVDAILRKGPQWQLFSEGKSLQDQVWDAVIFAIPAPQVTPILGEVHPSWAATLGTIRMSPCWTVMASTTSADPMPFDAAFVNSGPLSWVANNQSKPGRSGPPIWTLHASLEWSANNLNLDASRATAIMVETFETLSSASVTATTTHRWLYARAQEPLQCYYLMDSELSLAACGDWLFDGTIEGAYVSGASCADEVNRRFRDS